MDPYAKAVSINGEKSMVIDMEALIPKDGVMIKAYIK